MAANPMATPEASASQLPMPVLSARGERFAAMASSHVDSAFPAVLQSGVSMTSTGKGSFPRGSQCPILYSIGRSLSE